MTAQNSGQTASPLRLGIAGLGTVGTGTVKIIQNHAALLAARSGRPVAINAVSARDRMKNRDIDLTPRCNACRLALTTGLSISMSFP